jgi:hypothetical protein
MISYMRNYKKKQGGQTSKFQWYRRRGIPLSKTYYRKYRNKRNKRIPYNPIHTQAKNPFIIL